jgi:hypothetical protein
MPYNNSIPNEANQLRTASGDIAYMQTNFDILGSLVSGMTAPAQGDPMSELVVTSGAVTWGLGWSGTNGALLYSGAVKATLATGAFTLTGVVLAGDQAATEDTHYVRLADMTSPKNLVEVLGGHVVTLASGSIYALDERAMYGYDVKELHAQTASGTVVVTAKIGSTAISGMEDITISGAQSSTNSSAAFTVTSGDRLTLVLGAVSGTPSDLTFTFKLVRT